MTEHVGIRVARELVDMGVTLLPKRFEVWFVHRNHENRILSLKIEEHLANGGRISNVYLDRLCSEFLDDGPAGGACIECAGELGESSENISDLAVKLADSIDEFETCATSAVRQLSRPDIDKGDVLEIIGTTASKARQTLAEAQALKDDLVRANETIVNLRSSLKEAQKAAITDPLTGLFNRRHFARCMDACVEEATRSGYPLSLIMADIDRFKLINDTWGHQTGDHVIQFVAKLISSNTKGKDIVARFGGEEFVILLPETTSGDAVLLAEQLRRAMAMRTLRKRSTNEFLGTVTMSWGVAEAVSGECRDALIEAADAALYQAKNEGRNRVVVATHEMRSSLAVA